MNNSSSDFELRLEAAQASSIAHGKPISDFLSLEDFAEYTERKRLQTNASIKASYWRNRDKCIQKVKDFQKTEIGKLGKRYQMALYRARENGWTLLVDALKSARALVDRDADVDVPKVYESLGLRWEAKCQMTELWCPFIPRIPKPRLKNISRMPWSDRPASENQIAYLKLFGFVKEGLTKGEAHDLLGKFVDDPERCRIRDENYAKTDVPATEKQVAYLKLYGFVKEGLKKGEAMNLLDKFENDPERCRIRDDNRMDEVLRNDELWQKNLLSNLRMAYEEAKREIVKNENLLPKLRMECEEYEKAFEKKCDAGDPETEEEEIEHWEANKRVEDAEMRVEAAEQAIEDAKDDLANAKESRVFFWEATITNEAGYEYCPQYYDLHHDYGYRFKVPTKKQIQSILDAQDAASATWDTEMPEVFFETLELNFPKLRRK